MKQILKSVLKTVKIVCYSGIVGLSFYSGMCLVSTYQDQHVLVNGSFIRIKGEKELIMLLNLSPTLAKRLFKPIEYDANPKQVMKTAVKNAIRSTENQPIIVIQPNYSFIEKCKGLVGLKIPERETVVITTNVATRSLLGEKETPGAFKAILTATNEFGKVVVDNMLKGTNTAWAATKNGFSWMYNKVKFWD